MLTAEEGIDMKAVVGLRVKTVRLSSLM